MIIRNGPPTTQPTSAGDPSPDRPDLDGLIAISVAAHHEAVVVTVAGEVDMLTAAPLRDEIHRQLHRDPPVLVIDLTAVTFFASIGLSTILDAARAAGQQNTRLRLATDTAAVLQPLDATGLTAEFDIYPSSRAALDDDVG